MTTHTCSPPDRRPTGELWSCEACGHLWQNSVAANQWLGLTEKGNAIMRWVVDEL